MKKQIPKVTCPCGAIIALDTISYLLIKNEQGKDYGKFSATCSSCGVYHDDIRKDDSVKWKNEDIKTEL